MVKGASLEWRAAAARIMGGVLLGVIICLWAGWGPAYGADLLDRVRDQEIKQVLRLKVGGSRVVKTPFAVTRVSVGNPEIADIVVISDREVYINGLGPGVTNLTLWGRGTRISSTKVLVEADVSLLKEKLHQILPKEKIGVETAGDSIVLSGEVSSAAAQQTALELAAGFIREVSLKEQTGERITIGVEGMMPGRPGGGGELKGGGQKKFGEAKVINLMHVGGVHQVMLEVRVAEVQRDVGRRIGVNFMAGDRQGNFGVSMLNQLIAIDTFSRSFSGTTIDVAISTAVNAMAGWQTGSVLWTSFFNALKTQGLARILAEPNLVATSGQEATFLAGGEFPIPVPQAGAGGSVITIEYKKFGVALVFTPTVLDAGKIAIKVAPEVSELDFTTAPVNFAGYLVPGLRTRGAITHVELKDGQTFAIAGLISDNHRNTINKFPVLGDIPVLGSLFRSSSYQKNETELVVLVTPRLVKPMTTTATRLPTDRYIEPNDFEAYLLGALEGRNQSGRATPPPQNLPEGFGNTPVN